MLFIINKIVKIKNEKKNPLLLGGGATTPSHKTDWEACDSGTSTTSSDATTGSLIEAQTPPDGGAINGPKEGASSLPGMNQTGWGQSLIK